MPASLIINSAKDLANFSIRGDVSLTEIFNLMQEYKRSGYTKYEIYDFQQYTGAPFTFDDVKTFARYIYTLEPLRPKGGKSAFIHHHSDQIGFGVSRQLISLLKSEKLYFKMNAFYSQSDALKWLFIPNE